MLVTAVLVATGAASYFSLRGELQKRYEGNKQVIVKRLGNTLVRALWNFDKEQAIGLVDAEMDSSDVVEISVQLNDVDDQKPWFTRSKVDRENDVNDLDIVRLPLLASVPHRSSESADSRRSEMGILKIIFSRQGFERLLFQQLRNQLAGIIVLNLMLMFALYFVTNRMVIDPLARLSKAFSDLARNPRSQGIGVQFEGEFGDIVGAFNQIERRLLSDIEQLVDAENKLRIANRELVSTQGQLLQSEKMAAVGQLAAGVAHEINNPIAFVNSNMGTLKNYAEKLMAVIDACEQGDSEKIKEACAGADIEYLREDLPVLFAESLEGLGRVAKIVQDLKDYSRVSPDGHQPADLNAAMTSTLNVVWHELKYKAEVIRELTPTPSVDCFSAQINQVFTNLLVNAVQAIPERGKIYVRSRQEGENVVFEIEDSGSGMSEEIQRRIFEPFFTTKPVGKGTGLGLSISYDIIVKKHGGRLEVRSEVGKGTCFRIVLPIAFASVETKA